MSFELQHMLAAKAAFRRDLAARPLREKLHLLDELRARALTLQRAARSDVSPGAVAEPPAEYRGDSPGRHS